MGWNLDHSPRVVVVGYGRWGKFCHAGLIRSTPGLVLHGIVSASQEKQASIRDELGCRVYTDLESALADPDVDMVTLATPNSTHAEMAVRALSAGKHVITDKIMCLTLEDCDRMIAAARTHDCFLTVFQNRRCDGDFRTIRELIASGRLGDVRWAEMAWQGFGRWGRWRGQAAMGGGKIYDLGPHLIDQILQLFPAPVTSVYCRTHYDFPEADIESEALIVITFAGGQTAVVDLSSLAAVPKPHFYIRGTAGTFAKSGLDPQERAMMQGDIDAAREDPETFGTLKTADREERVPTLPGRWRDFFENARDVLTQSASPLVSLDEARRVMQVIDAAKASSRSGQVIRLSTP